MPIERETIIERPAASSGSAGVIGAVIAAVLAVIVILWLVNGGITSNGEAVNVDLPNVTVTN